jgi:hypothetical protein
MRMSSGRRFLGCLVAWATLAALVPALASAGSISGTVTAEGGGPIQGVEVCATPEPESFETACAETNAAGQYLLGSLPGWLYRLRFSGERNNLKYVSEWHEDARYYWELDLVQLGVSEDRAVNAQLAEGGSIAGTLTDEVTKQPIAGIRACAIDQQGMEPRCSLSDANGDYLLNGLPSGTYSVEYRAENRVNYLHEFYEDAETWAQATDVSVTVGATATGIDAELAQGAQIFGHVSDVVRGGPVEDVFVCAFEEEPGEYQECDWTDSAGNYGLRGLPAATYLVAFEPDYYPFGILAQQWWQGAATAEEADPIVIAPPETRTGIDGQVERPFYPPPEAGGGAVTPPPPIVRKPRPRKCKKGFHRKLVKGKKRCVRKHKKHQRRRGGNVRGR